MCSCGIHSERHNAMVYAMKKNKAQSHANALNLPAHPYHLDSARTKGERETTSQTLN